MDSVDRGLRKETTMEDLRKTDPGFEIPAL
jgi:hypothetical protein